MSGWDAWKMENKTYMRRNALGEGGCRCDAVTIPVVIVFKDKIKIKIVISKNLIVLVLLGTVITWGARRVY